MCEKNSEGMTLEDNYGEYSIIDGSCDLNNSQDSHSSQESLHPQLCTHHKFLQTKKLPPSIQHEVNMAKSILQEMSSISGNNLYVICSQIVDTLTLV